MSANPVYVGEGLKREITRSKSKAPLTRLEKMALRRAHPHYIVVNLIATTWAFYWLWNHELISAMSSMVAAVFIGHVLTARPKNDLMAQTVWGKMALLHLHPANLLVQSAGIGCLGTAVWLHSAFYIMMGISILLVGHLWGWSKVHSSL